MLIKVNKNGYMNVGEVFLAKKKSKASAVIKFYTGIKWVLFRNDNYEEVVNGEFPNEFYKTRSQVPVYTAYKDNNKTSYFFPRESENGSKYIVSIQTITNKKTLKKHSQKFYINDGFDRDYNIVMPTKIARNTRKYL
jgi:hypothetical protein